MCESEITIYNRNGLVYKITLDGGNRETQDGAITTICNAINVATDSGITIEKLELLHRKDCVVEAYAGIQQVSCDKDMG